jgi:hypothetical protein
LVKEKAGQGMDDEGAEISKKWDCYFGIVRRGLARGRWGCYCYGGEGGADADDGGCAAVDGGQAGKIFCMCFILWYIPLHEYESIESHNGLSLSAYLSNLLILTT